MESFDRSTKLGIGQFLLRGMDASTLKKIIDVDESDFPVEYGQHDVPVDKLAAFAAFIDDETVLEPSLDYEVALLAD
ncbi:DUF7683 domain-containing protein [Antrihabitans cavernicola]|uniref:DUF7683 domain-containing protein n=1 Tax=Antrihabitans cavernicola TaxID=2495913 RepID=A0A5A7SGI1_9NOCA|nr:hypothetical protein [Spelaeibacter cavernicola]KAA0024539.1 hypothetical protein FOY51_00825 [Spelaeibacter cavernicola]